MNIIYMIFSYWVILDFFSLNARHVFNQYSLAVTDHPPPPYLLDVKFFNVRNPHIIYSQCCCKKILKFGYISVTNLYDEYLILLVVKYFNVDIRQSSYIMNPPIYSQCCKKILIFGYNSLFDEYYLYDI